MNLLVARKRSSELVYNISLTQNTIIFASQQPASGQWQAGKWAINWLLLGCTALAKWVSERKFNRNNHILIQQHQTHIGGVNCSGCPLCAEKKFICQAPPQLTAVANDLISERAAHYYHQSIGCCVCVCVSADTCTSASSSTLQAKLTITTTALTRLCCAVNSLSLSLSLCFVHLVGFRLAQFASSLDIHTHSLQSDQLGVTIVWLCGAD